jgi:hypothetical protein
MASRIVRFSGIIGMTLNHKFPILAALLAILAFALDGAAWAAGPAAPVAKLGKNVQGAIKKGVTTGRAAKKPARGRAKHAKTKKGRSGKGHGSHKSWQRSHGWHAGLLPGHGKDMRLDLAVNDRPGAGGLDSGVCRS